MLVPLISHFVHSVSDLTFSVTRCNINQITEDKVM